jgi:hypothetical protein
MQKLKLSLRSINESPLHEDVYGTGEWGNRSTVLYLGIICKSMVIFTPRPLYLR